MSKNWEKVVLSTKHTVHDALTVINAAALRICLVVDDKRHLLGVVTDGDIRRAILSNVALTQSVTEVMNKAPITVSAKLSRAQLLDTMSTQGGSILCWLFNQRIVVPDNCHPSLLFLACFSGSVRRNHSVLLCSEQTV